MDWTLNFAMTVFPKMSILDRMPTDYITDFLFCSKCERIPKLTILLYDLSLTATATAPRFFFTFSVVFGLLNNKNNEK